nr:PAS domain-containing protein [Caballeronia sp. GAWG1-1]
MHSVPQSKTNPRIGACEIATAALVWRRRGVDGKVTKICSASKRYSGRHQRPHRTSFATRQQIDAGWFDAVHPDDRERVRRQWRGVVEDRLCSTLAFRLMQREQGYRSMTARIVPIFDDTDELVKWFCVTVDRTQEEEGIAAIKDRDLRLFVAMRGARTTTIIAASIHLPIRNNLSFRCAFT